MSEPITKTCERPSCDHGNRYTLDHNGIVTAVTACPDCSGTGRVPDIEATLRAEVARLTKENTRLAAEKQARELLAHHGAQPEDRMTITQDKGGFVVTLGDVFLREENTRLAAEVAHHIVWKAAVKQLLESLVRDGFCQVCGVPAHMCALDPVCPRHALLAGCAP